MNKVASVIPHQKKKPGLDPKKILWTLEVPKDSIELGVVAWGANARGDVIALHLTELDGQPQAFLVGRTGHTGRILDSRHNEDQYALRTILPINKWPRGVEVTCPRTIRSTRRRPHIDADPEINKLALDHANRLDALAA